MGAEKRTRWGSLLSAVRWRRRYLFVVFVVCLGVALSAAAFVEERTRQEQLVWSDFEQDAKARIFECQKMIAANFEVLCSTRSFYAASHFVDRDEFRTFVTPALSHHPGIQALEWIPRVPVSQRADHEEAARHEGYPEYQILERETQGTMVRAALRDEYFPVYYVEPYEGNEAALGFDLASNPTRLAALNQSRDTGQAVATGRITLVQETGNQFGFLVFVPVYRNGFPVGTVVERREYLEWFILGVYRVGGISHHSLMMLNPSKATEDMDLHVFDRSAAPEEQLLFSNAPITHGEGHMESPLSYVDRLSIGGREWEVAVGLAAPPGWQIWQPWAVLGVGLAVAILLSAYLLTAIRRTSVVERLVLARTLELSRSNQRLGEEIGERERAQEALLTAHDELEGQVKERTMELSKTNEALSEEISGHKQTAVALEKARDGAVQASRAKWEFLADMSHELRTPLNAIIGYSEMLEEQVQNHRDFVSDLGKIRGSGRHLLEVIDGILDISKIEASKVDLYIEDLSILEMVEDVVGMAGPLAEKNANSLRVHCEGDVGTMRAERVKVRQTLFNLLSNACKFTRKGAIILAVTRRGEDGREWLAFEVTDTGVGMDFDQISRIFVPFTQGDSSTTRKYGGTGLGLAIGYSFCRMMGGEITVDSEPGKGSTFILTLPVGVVESEVTSGPATGCGSGELTEKAGVAR